MSLCQTSLRPFAVRARVTDRACSSPTRRSDELARLALERLLEGRIDVIERRPAGLVLTAWSIATDLGWAKTYDAEYLAAARLLDTRVVTLDMRLRRGADRLGLVVTPAELVSGKGVEGAR